ncbi:hypothetical protein FJT64_022282 [Amphibalanus amphitrite]|uniref:Uncharacterized protein n=1 Tax=Amphibalanus amphitrite TaxID=1232801 RepID=A0A6A4WQU4_AMPAM|nr:hypothetical protein FJT64_022282 [Amphibalanus amphitrite]
MRARPLLAPPVATPMGVTADTISQLATELGSRLTLLVTDAQITTIPSQLRGAIIRVDPNTTILPAGVGDSELTELRSSRETVKRLSVSAADLPRLRGQLPEGLQRLNVRGPEVTEPRWPERDEDDGLSVLLQGVTADTISHLADLGRTVNRLEIYDCTDLTAGSLEPLTRCPELHSLTLSGGVPDTVSLEPLTRCPELFSLTLSGGVPDTVSLEPLTRCPKLQYLTLSGGVPDTVSLEPLTRCPGLELLSVSAADLPLLRGQLPEGLRCLNVRDCPDLTAGSLEPLTRCPELHSLTLSGGVPDTVSLEPLTRCRGLRELTLSGGVPDTVSLEPLTRCPGLRYLTLSGGVPDTVSLEPLTRCRGLLYLSVSAADLPLLRGQLPEGLQRLNVRGPEVTEPRWPEWYPWDDGLSVSLQGVAADTISHLADLGRMVRRLEIYDCPALTAGSLEPLTRCRDLGRLTLSGGVPDTVSLEPLTRCPGLWRLTLSGGVPDAVLDSLSGCPGLYYLTLGDRQRPAETAFTAAAVTRLVESCRELWWLSLHCTADTGRAVLTALKEADLGRHSNGRPRTIGLIVPDCPDLTAGSLEPLTRCPKLRGLTLSGGVPDTGSLEPLTRCPGLERLTLSGGVPDSVLDSLSGCPGLYYLTLGDRQRPAETAFTAAAVTRLVKSCRKLCHLFLHCTADTTRAVLTALEKANLVRDSDGDHRTIWLHVLGELYDQLKSQEGDGVTVWEWRC